MPHVRICAGGGPQGPSLPRPLCSLVSWFHLANSSYPGKRVISWSFPGNAKPSGSSRVIVGQWMRFAAEFFAPTLFEIMSFTSVDPDKHWGSACQ